MKFLKQWMDRAAIRLATKVLPAQCPHGEPAREALTLLSDSHFLQPEAKTAELQWEANGSFRFRSNVTTAHPRNNLVHGRFFPAERDWRRQRSVILVHGWNAEMHYLYGFPRLARRLNGRGFNAFVFELPYHLQRRPRGPEEMCDFICEDLGGMLRATKQAIADIESLLLWILNAGGAKTAVWGFSLGAWLVGLHLSQSETPDAAVLTTPVSDLARAVETLPFCFPIRTALAETRAPLDRLNLTSHTPKIPPAKILVTEALYDEFVPTETYAALAEKWKLPSWQKVPQSHISILMSRPSMKRTIDWLHAEL